MVEETLHRTVTEGFADLFRKMEQTNAYHIDAMKVEISEQSTWRWSNKASPKWS
jgi:hypothetical protein